LSRFLPAQLLCASLRAAKGVILRQVRCRFLSLGFEPHFSRTISLGDGVIEKSRLSHFRKPPEIPSD
jgi:hypothetical protein